MNEKGDFNGILTVLAALRHDDPELYELCLRYPDKFAPREIKQNLRRYGYRIEPYVGDLQETLEYLFGEEIPVFEDEGFEEIAEILAERIEIYTDSMATPITVYNEDAETALRLYYNSDTDEYRPVTKINKKKANKKVQEPKRKKVAIRTHCSPDVQILWGVTDDTLDMTNKVCQVYIDSTVVVNNWEERLQEAKDWIDEYEQRPRTNEQLGQWINHQQYNYKKCTEAMKDPEKRQKWEEFITNYSEYLISPNDKWYNNLQEVKDWIDENQKRPSINSEDLEEKRLGKWISHQTTNYKKRTKAMKDLEQRQAWENFVEEYSSYMMNFDEKWYTTLQKVKDWIDKNKKRPSCSAADTKELRYARWLTNQKKYYKNNAYAMNVPEHQQKWEEFINEYWDDG